MSFKCSIFGHRYGEPEVEREREEDGSEVVITIRETETCERCGELRVISENKEVTTLETAADIVADDLEDDPPDSTGPAEQDEWADPDPAVESDSPTAVVDPVIPDAETGDEITPGRDDHPPEPEPEREDDAVILDDEDEDDEDGQERAPGEWPAEPTEEEEDDDWEPSTEPEPEPLDSEPIQRTDNAVTVPEGEFYCPECEFTTQVADSSLRAGDFCPECHRGALEHHTE